jgi:hypothetical protein
MDFWPIISGTVVCQSKSFSPIVPETLGESASLNQTDIPGLCLTAVYQLLDEGKLTIADVDGAYARAKESAK